MIINPYRKPDSKTFFINDVFGTDEYFSNCLQMKVSFCYLVNVMLSKTGKISGKEHITNYLETKNDI